MQSTPLPLLPLLARQAGVLGGSCLSSHARKVTPTGDKVVLVQFWADVPRDAPFALADQDEERCTFKLN